MTPPGLPSTPLPRSDAPRGGATAAGRVALGIDVGGTKIAGGLVDCLSGEVLLAERAPTPVSDGEATLAAVAAMVRRLREGAAARGLAPAGIGLGLAELVSPEGRVFSGYRIPLAGVDVGARLGAGLPLILDSDVRAAARAEARFGAGSAHADFLFVTIGTGVSAVLVQRGLPYAGARGAALVIANGRRRHRCPVCGTDTAEIVEDIASGPGIAQAAGVPDAVAALAAAAAGDPRARAAIDHAARALGDSLALLVGALDPGAIVIGGGLGSAPGPYAEALESAIRAGLWADDPRPDLPILRAGLGGDAGMIGAALAFAERHREARQRAAPLTA